MHVPFIIGVLGWFSAVGTGLCGIYAIWRTIYPAPERKFDQ